MHDVIHGKPIRAYHQLFSHTILRKVAMHDPWLFFEMLSSEVGMLFLMDLWHQAMESCGGGECTVVPDDFQITYDTVLNFPVIFIALPEPEALDEAYHVGVVCLACEPPELAMEKPDIRFFTHEAYTSLRAEAGLAVCEWACEPGLRLLRKKTGLSQGLAGFQAEVKRSLEGVPPTGRELGFSWES